ncbi:MAG TPA: zinc ABC transporter substrate-binding protein [Capillimicrobium sp.]|nr:zinc ABC transporter substrate-binding protein [Capillimicrobium sp.]
MFEPFTLPFVQRGLVEVLLLALAAGLVGTWIVLRGLAFHAHAVGTATFPGLVVADGLGFAAPLGALAAAALFTAGVAVALHGRDAAEEEHGPPIALVLVACLAGGIVLASDVFGSGANVNTLLFGSLLLIDDGDVAIAAVAAALALAGSLLLGRRWLAAGFDRVSARALGLRSRWPDAALLALVAVVAVAALSAVGALLATALLVVPAATTRLLTDRMLPWQVSTVVLAAVEGTFGLWLSVKTDAPPGATIAVVAGAAFALALAARALGVRRGAALAAAALALGGCGSAAPGGSGDRVDVVASTPVVADLVREVGGADVAVTQLLEPNSDPHEYEPRPSDVADAANADVVVQSGLGLDHWVDQVVEQSGADPRIADLGAGVPVHLDGPDAEPDPHWWHDPRNAAAAAGAIASALGDADPDRAVAYRRNADRFTDEVARQAEAIDRCLQAIPRTRRVIVTDHDALDYFARRYGIEVVGAIIPSTTTGAQASAGDLARLDAVIRERDVPAVFPAEAGNRRLADAVSRDTGAVVGEPLYADTIGPAGSDGETLLGATAHNADAIVRGLSGGRDGCPKAAVT